jgi:hypothetical protein
VHGFPGLKPRSLGNSFGGASPNQRGLRDVLHSPGVSLSVPATTEFPFSGVISSVSKAAVSSRVAGVHLPPLAWEQDIHSAADVCAMTAESRGADVDLAVLEHLTAADARHNWAVLRRCAPFKSVRLSHGPAFPVQES